MYTYLDPRKKEHGFLLRVSPFSRNEDEPERVVFWSRRGRDPALECVYKGFDVSHGEHGIRLLGVAPGGASEGPDARIVFGETSGDVGWILEEIIEHDDLLDLVAGGHVVRERTSAEHGDVRYGRVVGGGAIDLKAGCVAFLDEYWIGRDDDDDVPTPVVPVSSSFIEGKSEEALLRFRHLSCLTAEHDGASRHQPDWRP